MRKILLESNRQAIIFCFCIYCIGPFATANSVLPLSFCKTLKVGTTSHFVTLIVSGLVLQQKVFPNITPTPWAVASFLEQSDVAIYNGDGEELQYSPWAGKDDHDQVRGVVKFNPGIQGKVVE